MVAGAVAPGLVGVIAASLRNLPAMPWGQAKRAFVVTATLDSRNDLFVAFFNARDMQDWRITISLSGRLNALDGVGAQEGRIIVLTTNHRERLDAALIRPGRIDVEIELGHANAHQLEGMLLRFFPDAQAHAARLVADYPDGALSPAQIQKILIAAASAQEAEAGLRAGLAAPKTRTQPGCVDPAACR